MLKRKSLRQSSVENSLSMEGQGHFISPYFPDDGD